MSGGKWQLLKKQLLKRIHKAHLEICFLPCQDGFQNLVFLLRMVFEPTSTVSFIFPDTCLLPGDARMHSDVKYSLMPVNKFY